MKKRLTACMTAACLAATAVGVAVSLTGCGGEGDKFPTKESDPTASIDILLLANADETEFYNKYFARKAEEYGIKITFQGLEENPYEQKLDAALQGGNLPDIFYVRPNDILQYKDNIYCLEQFKDTVATNEKLNLNLDNIAPLALDLYKYNDQTNMMDAKNGELYAFPKDLSVQQLGYNKTIVGIYASAIKAAGLDLPWEMDFSTENYSWQEYRQMCEIITREAKAAKNKHYASDVPDIEILTKSFGGNVLNTETMQIEVTSAAATKAIDYQKSLVTGENPAADYTYATQANFQAGKVAFYGMVGSWEVGTYDSALGEGNWDVMPWPTEDGSVNWNGKITSAGYVVSNKCKNWQVAMEIAASFMTNRVQEEMVRDEKVSIPMSKSLQSAYLNSENDAVYSPKSRSVFIDVINGDHGFRPAVYSTFEDGWMKPLNDELQKMWKGQSYSITANTQKEMQRILDDYKNLY